MTQVLHCNWNPMQGPAQRATGNLAVGFPCLGQCVLGSERGVALKTRIEPSDAGQNRLRHLHRGQLSRLDAATDFDEVEIAEFIRRHRWALSTDSTATRSSTRRRKEMYACMRQPTPSTPLVSRPGAAARKSYPQTHPAGQRRAAQMKPRTKLAQTRNVASASPRTQHRRCPRWPPADAARALTSYG